MSSKGAGKCLICGNATSAVICPKDSCQEELKAQLAAAMDKYGETVEN